MAAIYLGPSPARRDVLGSRIRLLVAATIRQFSAADHAVREAREPRTLRIIAISFQTLPCTYLSAVLPAGLVLNTTLGWSGVDPIAA